MAAKPERAYTSCGMGRTGSGFGRRSLLRGGLALAGLGLLSGCGLPPVPGQQPPKVPRIGALVNVATGVGPMAFLRGMGELGYVEGQNITIEWRSTQGNAERAAALAAELVELKVDLIYTSGTQHVLAAKQATTTIPIVMTALGDPVALGVINSLNRPGGNITGVANLAPQLSGKRLELLKETVPGASRIAILSNGAIADRDLDLRESRAAAQTLAVELHSAEARDPSEFESAFASMAGAGVDALVVLEDPLFFGPQGQGPIIELTARFRLPAMYTLREMVQAGGLMAYGPSFIDAHRRAAAAVDKILKGAKPADLPVEQPTKFDFVINLKTAQALGLTFPQEVLMQATEVIQ